MVLFYFVFPVRDETEKNNERAGLSNSLASSILIKSFGSGSTR